ncbi:MAG: YfhO family protein, partial [Oscillospiraceae bacterium]|nr:YfhO family protein [Oscillospiraceae bacterium]
MNNAKRCCLGSMALAAAGLLTVYLLVGIFPFSDKTVLTGDLAGVYMPVASYFGNTDSFSLFSFSKGLGGGIQGLAANFPLSPYMLLLRLVPAQGLGIFFTILVFAKQTAAAGSMCWYLCKRTSPSVFTALLGFCYSFMSYNIAYSQNTMWIDNIVLLPLILYSLEHMINSGKPAPFCALLAFSILSNYYTAYMICLFLIPWTCIEVFGVRRMDIKASVGVFARFACSGLLAVCLSAVLLLPVAVQTLQNKGVGGGVSGLLFSPGEFFRQYIFCGFTWDQMESGLPLVYCGFVCAVGVILYFVVYKARARQMLMYAALLLLLLLSFFIAPVNRAWHLFRDPVWFG